MKKVKKYMDKSGITLIALVVTIVVLLILAGITISLVFSDNGIIAKAREASEKTNQATIDEQAEMNKVTDYMNNMLNGASGGNTTPEEPEEPEEPTIPLPSDGSYSEEKGVNTPNLGEGMTPIKWDETASEWIDTEGSDREWYDYENKEWANARTSDGSIWVWIPRYAYSITSGYHSNSVGTIEIEFMKGISDETSTGRTTFQNASGQGNWNIHPAFTYGEKISGIWVAKFEASRSDATSSSVGSSNTIKVQPGVSSWRNITVNDIYTNCLNYNTTLNSHMMKNDEWGAVAYLSKSIYGKNDEVTINNNSSYCTGGGSGNTYVTNAAQSTTGNVYGIYDMSGGAWEYVAAYVNNGKSSLTEYGSSLISGNEMTKNIYTKSSSENTTNDYNANSGIYGDAIYETSSNSSAPWNLAWYNDYSSFPSSFVPFFRRGGGYSDTTKAGVFYFGSSDGSDTEEGSFRPTLVVF